MRARSYETAYASAIVAAGTIAIVLSLHNLYVSPISPRWLIIAGFTLVSGAMTLRMSSVPTSFSVSDTFTLATLLLFGPSAATLTVALDALVMALCVGKRQSGLKLAFNATEPALAMWLAGQLFAGLAGGRAFVDPASVGSLLLPLTFCTAVYFVLQTGLVAVVVALSTEKPIFDVWRDNYTRLWASFFGGAYIAGLLVFATRELGPAYLIVVLPLPLILHYTFKIALGSIEDHINHLARLDTERSRAEGARRQSETMFRTLTETMAAAVFIHADERFHYVNPAAEVMTGYSREELSTMAFRQITDPASQELLQSRLSELKDGAERTRSCEIKLVTKGGEDRWVEISAALIPFEGRPAVIGAAFDITERKWAEDQLRQAQKMEAVGRLAGGVAHDFNNLLTAIVGYSELLHRQVAHNDQLRSDVEEIQRAADRASDLTRQLLAFGRKQVLKPTVIDLNLSVAGIQRMLQRLIGEHVELQTISARGLGHVKGDPGQIDQVIINLAVNARDAMANGGKLTIETRNVDLDERQARKLGSATAGRYVVLSVNDTGVGIEPDTMGHLFEPFFTTKDVGKGTGLGLATVYSIVKQSGGYISVASEPEHGTTFTIYFPCVEDAVESSEARNAPEPRKGSETVLLVEDEHAVRGLATQVLQQLGYRVLDAESGEAALRLSRSHHEPIHLLVSDVVMPGISGLDLVGRLLRERPDLKVLFMSGYSDHMLAEHNSTVPHGAFLQKPFTPTRLAQVVREVLDVAPV